MSKTQNPIGIFDSGTGGLTVAKAVRKLLPNENLIYFGDTAHLPYGDKSTEAIQSYSLKIANFLMAQHCKVILIACNSASAASYKLLKEYVGSKARVMNVIDPMVAHISERYAGKNIGLIGTKQTINSNVYKKKIDDLNQNITLKSLATPLLAPMIEEGFAQNKILANVVEQYLSDVALENIEALILGCTHYPLIKNQINNFYNSNHSENNLEDNDKSEVENIVLLDSSEIVAKSLRGMLEMEDLLNRSVEKGKSKFYISDYTKSFEATAQLFFDETLHLSHYPLWE